jgi:hypothetical protein
MNIPQNRPPQDSVFDLLRPHFGFDPRRLTVLVALVIAVIEARSAVLWQLLPIIQLNGSENTVYKRLKRFLQFDLDQLLIARFVLAFLKDEKHLLLILDRTNWKWGQQNINILILSVSWNSFAFPLAWKLLPHGGNSKTDTRIALIESIFPLLSDKKLSLLADREFIGKQWFGALKRLNISPCIRLKSTTMINHMPAWSRFTNLELGEYRFWYERMTIYGVKLRVLACKNHKGDILYLAYHGHAEQAMERYAKRWGCETMHQALKSRGFHMEDTHVTDMNRITTLFGVLVIAFVWCCLTGEQEECRELIKKLAHGYPPKSLFRRGLDALRRAIRDLSRSEPRASGPCFTQLLTAFVP